MKSEQIIMVIERNTLFSNNYFEGFCPAKTTNYESIVLNNIKWMKRGIAEEDSTHKQPIGYTLLVNPKLKKVFAYQRAVKDQHYGEKRLQGKYSWGIGGHIEKIDTARENPIEESMLRELNEEVEMNGNITSQKVLGYINYDSDSVGKVHFGVLYLAETDATIVKPKDNEMANGQLRSIEELKEICDSKDNTVEEWSNLSLNPLKEYFSQ
jgi:predicted NUDIX family phosphoesterase